MKIVEKNCCIRIIPRSREERIEAYMDMDKKALAEMHINLEDIYFEESRFTDMQEPLSQYVADSTISATWNPEQQKLDYEEFKFMEKLRPNPDEN